MRTICEKCGNTYNHKKDCPIMIAEKLLKKRPKSLMQFLYVRYWLEKLLTPSIKTKLK